MKIVDETVLDLFRAAGECEWCHALCRRRQPHHYWYSRGMGGGSRLDHPFNLVGLCVSCHAQAHAAIISRRQLLDVVARREKVRTPEVLTTLWRLYRTPKE